MSFFGELRHLSFGKSDWVLSPFGVQVHLVWEILRLLLFMHK
jgi:hypothetical protein